MAMEMSKKERLTMIEMAMKALAETKTLDEKGKKRGLKSLERAYQRFLDPKQR